MSRRLEHAIERMRALPEMQQEALAEFLLHEIADDERWAKSTQDHSAKVKSLINEVLADDKKGKCAPLDPERL